MAGRNFKPFSRIANWLRWNRPGGAQLGLSAKLLLLTVAFVMLAEVLIFFPSASAFRLEWMQGRVQDATTAALAVEAAPDRMVSEELTRRLLENAEVLAIAQSRNGVRELILMEPGLMTDNIQTVDLRGAGPVREIGGLIGAFFAEEDRTLRILATPSMGEAAFIEVLVPHAPLEAALIDYSRGIFFLSVFISLITASLIYVSLTYLLVRPIRRLSTRITRFRDDPERAPARPAGGRRDEIGEAERAFCEMQTDLKQSLKQKARLAALGAAVARISHDLRNILTSAQLVSDRLAREEDPRVKQMGERLVRAVSRGVNLTETTLKYGKAEEREPQPAPLHLRSALDEAAVDAGAQESSVKWRNEADAEASILFDPEHFHRVAVNLIRNGVQALDGREGAQLTARSEITEMAIRISLADNGPGVPEPSLKTLFQPFGQSGRAGGSGLGLSIARELARANDGDLILKSNGPDGAVFELTAPRA